MKAKIGNIEIEGTPEECKAFLNNLEDATVIVPKSNSPQKYNSENVLLGSGDTDNQTKEEYYGHKKEVMKDYA